MKRLLFLLGFIISFAVANTAAAEITDRDVMVVSGAWAKATPAGISTTALYMNVNNTGIKSDRLTGATTPYAETIEIHDASAADALVTGVELGSRAVLALRPGVMYLLVVGLSQQLKPGDKIPLTLQFEKASAVTVSIPVLAAGAKPPPGLDEVNWQ